MANYVIPLYIIAFLIILRIVQAEIHHALNRDFQTGTGTILAEILDMFSKSK